MTSATVQRLLFGITIAALMGVAAYAGVALSASAFFSKALKEERISQTVFLGGTSYDVQFGAVSAGARTQIGLFERFRAIRLAYASVLARRDPVLGIAGVDPGALHEAVRKLSAVQSRMADAQAEARDAALIRSLYPSDFLDSLASLEDARLSFIRTPSEATEERYDLALMRAASLGSDSIRSFARSFSEVTGSDEARFPTYGGTITLENMRAALDALALRFSEVSSALRERRWCLDGYRPACEKSEIAFSLPDPAPELTGSFSHVSLDAVARPSSKDDTIVALSESACLGATSAPYVFTYGELSAVSRLPIAYSGDIFFAPTAGYTGNVMSYLRDSLHISYSLVNPIEFYICPDVLSDIATVSAVVRTAQFAREYSDYAPDARTLFLSGPTLLEPRARDYVREAAADIRSRSLQESDPSLSAFEELLDVWQEKSAGLDDLVSAVASVDATDVNERGKGAPFDFTVKTLYLTHTAFPSFYLGDNPSAGRTALHLRTIDLSDLSALEKRQLRFSDLKRTVPVSVLIHDLQAFLDFEGIRAH